MRHEGLAWEIRFFRGIRALVDDRLRDVPGIDTQGGRVILRDCRRIYVSYQRRGDPGTADAGVAIRGDDYASLQPVDTSGCGIECSNPGDDGAGHTGETLYDTYSSYRECNIMNPASILALITIAEQLAGIIAQEVNATTTQQEQVAWTAAQQFYLQGLGALKAKVQAEQASAGNVA